MTDAAVRLQAESHEPMPVRVKDPSIPTHPWSPPLEAHGIEHLLNILHEWEPVDWEAVYDGLDIVLGGEVSHHAAGAVHRGQATASVLAHGDAEELAQQFRGALMQLVHRGLRDDADRYPDIADLIERARGLRDTDLPGDPQQALALLRKFGLVTLELAERLEEVGIVTRLVEC